MVVTNPEGGTTASGPVRVEFSAPGDISVKRELAGTNLRVRYTNEYAKALIPRSCLRKNIFNVASSVDLGKYFSPPTARRIGNAFHHFACQDGSPRELLADHDLIEKRGVDLPECFGTSAFGNARTDVRFQIICPEPVDVLGFFAQPGNTATACTAPDNAFCSAGPQCSPARPEGACFFHPFGGTPIRTPIVHSATWAGAVQSFRNLPLIETRAVGPGNDNSRPWVVPDVP